MSVRFSKVGPERFEELCAFYQRVISQRRAHGCDQWEWGVYPTPALLENEIARDVLYCALDSEKMIAAFSLSDQSEEEYAQISWQYGVAPAVLRCFAMEGERFDAELAEQSLAFAKSEALRGGFDSLRADTCRGEEELLLFFAGEMAREAGDVSFDNPAAVYACFETPLTAACPMLPVRMRPAYRYGEATPWGGDALRGVYHKRIPDERTGEALEISAIPGLESMSEMGETLSALIGREETRLMGGAAGGEFPLLLKLLAAREALSVQVHPDDAYARRHEGKLGKTEAWVILHAQEGASILYGMKNGVTAEALRAALEAGEDIEPMIKRVTVREGDVFYMPSGMVHAIGGGILLYEIQQSSDVTYRLWDYNRTNAAGEKRPLHLRQALDVIDPMLAGERASMPAQGGNELVGLLDVPAFTLECACVNGELELAPNPRGFRMITALAGLLLSWQGDALELAAGDSALLPASCPPVTLMGVGRALIATPPGVK